MKKEFVAYLSVKVAPEHNNEEKMEEIHAHLELNELPNFIARDPTGHYGLGYSLVDEENEFMMDYSLRALLGAKQLLEGFAKDNNINLQYGSWRIQSCYWHNDTDCPLYY